MWYAPYRMKVALSVGASCAGLPAGEHRIEVRMGWTPVRLAGAVVSETVLLVVLVLLVWPVQGRNRQRADQVSQPSVGQ